MRWAVVGATGMLGTDLVQVLREGGETVSEYSRPTLDLTQAVSELVSQFADIDVIVNCIGFTAVDLAETHSEEATRVNGVYAEKLAQIAKIVQARYFYVSTDYVFSGESDSPYSLEDHPDPQTAYGLSKLRGERSIQAVGGKYTIFRTSWLYGENGKSFPKAIWQRLLSSGKIQVVNDQYGTPTWTRDVAEVLMNHGLSNLDETLVHAVATGATSWFDFALEIADSLGFARDNIEAIGSREYPSAAARPKFSVLENSQYKGRIIGDWRERWRVAAPSVLSQESRPSK